MYHNILTQKDYPDYSQIKAEVDFLLEIIETDSIYFSQHLEGKVNIGIITVIVSTNSPHHWEDIYEYLWKIFKTRPDFSFRLYDAEWVMMEHNKGNPFFIMHCSEQELVYSVDGSDSAIVLKNCNRKRFVKKAKKMFKHNLNDYGIRGRDQEFYLKCENYSKAASLMYEQLCLFLVIATGFLTGEWIGSHSLEKLQKNLNKFSISLGKTFDPNKEEEWFVLEQLQNANAATQRNDEFEGISKETLKLAFVKLDWVEKKVRKLFRQSVARSKEKLDMINVK